MLRKNPGFTAIALITLTIGIGANTMTFSLLNILLLRPVQVERIEEVFGTLPTGPPLVIVFGPDDARAGAGLWRILAAWLGPDR